MKRLFVLAGSVLGVLLLAFVTFFFWASSSPLPEKELAQIKRYDAPPAPERDTFTVMTYNIGYLSGMTNNEPVERPDSLFANNMDRALGLIRDINPDFLALQEVDFGGARVNHVHQLDSIATRLGYHSAAQAVNWDKRYVPFPYGPPSVHFGRTLSGQAVLSRYPVRRHVRKELPRPPQSFLRDAFYLDRLAQFTVVDIGGWPLVIINLHLEAFDKETRQKQARRIVAIYKGLANRNFPVIMLGDFNTLAPASQRTLSPEQQHAYAGDSTLEILLSGTGLLPIFSESAYVSGQQIQTYPANDPDRKIDYILHRPNLVVPIDRQIRCGGSPPPSDHCAVAMTFMLPRPKEMLPDERIPDAELPALEELLGK